MSFFIDLDPLKRVLILKGGISSFLPSQVNIDAESSKLLPTFTKRQIYLFGESLDQGDRPIMCLKTIGFENIFSVSVVNMCFDHFSISFPPSNNICYIFLYQCLSFLMFFPGQIKGKEMEIDHLLILFLKCFPFLCSTPFVEISQTVFLLLLNVLFEEEQEEMCKKAEIVNQIIHYFLYDLKMPVSAFPFALKLVSLSLFSSETAEVSISMIDILLQENRIMLTNANFDPLIDILSPFFNNMDLTTLSVFFRIAKIFQSAKMKSHLNAFFTLAIQQIFTFPVITSISKFLEKPSPNPKSDSKSNSEETNDTFAVPSAEKIESGQFRSAELIHSKIQSLAFIIPDLIAEIEDFASFSDSFVDIKPTIEKSDHIIDIIMFLCHFLKAKVISGQIFDIIVNDFTFNPKYTIFSECGLTDIQNCVRNTIVESFFGCSDKKMQEMILLHSLSKPIIYSENLTRIMYHVPSFQYSLFSDVTLLNSLFSAVSLLRAQFDQKSDKTSGKLARAVIYSYFFVLIENESTALKCFAYPSFTSGFLSLVFNPELRDPLMNALTNMFSKFKVFPEIVSDFILKTFDICTINSKEKQFQELGKSFTLMIIEIMSHKVTIITGKTNREMLSKTLEFAERAPSKEQLDATLSLMNLVLCENEEMSNKEFNSIVDLVRNVDGCEPSDVTYNKLLNGLSSSSNLRIGQIFLIENPTFISTILTVFQESQKFSEIIDMFYDLCKFSESNSYCLQEGRLPYFLLSALNGPFEMKGRKICFSKSNLDSNKIFQLVTHVLDISSDYAAEEAFWTLISPFPLQKGFGQYALEALVNFNALISKQKTKKYPIQSMKPIVSMNDYNCENISTSFLFGFWAKIDQQQLLRKSARFVIFQLTDQDNNSIRLFAKRGSIFLEIINDGVTLACSIFNYIPENVWHFFTITCNTQNGKLNVYPGMNHSIQTEYQTRPFNFNKTANLKMLFKYEESGDIIKFDKHSPVTIGEFAMIDLPYCFSNARSFTANGLSALEEFENVRFTSKTIQMNKKFIGNNSSFFKNLSKRITNVNFLPILRDLKLAPKENIFADLLLDIIGRFPTSNVKVGADIKWTNETAQKFEKYTGIPIESDIKLKHIEQVPQSFASLLFNSLLNKLNYKTYLFFNSIFFDSVSFFDTNQNNSNSLSYSSDKSSSSVENNLIKNEMNELILYNLWFWCNADSDCLKKIFGSWAKLIHSNQKLCRNILIQMYFLVNFSKKETVIANKEVIESNCLSFLKILVNEKCFDDDAIDLLIALISVAKNKNEESEYIDILSEIANHFKFDEKRVYNGFLKAVNTTNFIYIYNIITKSTINELLRIEFLIFSFERFSNLYENLEKKSIDNSIIIIHSIIFLTFSDLSLINYDSLKNSRITLIFFVTLILLKNEFDSSSKETYSIRELINKTDLDYSIILNVISLIETTEVDFFNTEKLKEEAIFEYCNNLLTNFQNSQDKINIPNMVLRCFFSYFYVLCDNPIGFKLMNEWSKSIFNDERRKEVEAKRPMKMFDINNFLKRLKESCFNEKVTLKLKVPQQFEILFAILNNIINQNSSSCTNTDNLFNVVSSFISSSSSSLKEKKDFSHFPEIYQTSLQFCNSIIEEIKDFHRKEIILILPQEFDSQEIINKSLQATFGSFLQVLNVFDIQPPETAIKFSQFLPFPIENKLHEKSAIWEKPPNIIFESVCNRLISGSCFHAKVEISKYFISVITTLHTPLLIEFSDISAVFAFFKNEIEIFTNNCNSTLLQFEGTSKEKIIDVLTTHKIQVFNSPSSVIESILQKWQNYEISTFTLVLALNLLTGKSFNRSHPLLPGNGLYFDNFVLISCHFYVHSASSHILNKKHRRMSNSGESSTEMISNKNLKSLPNITTSPSSISTSSSFTRESPQSVLQPNSPLNSINTNSILIDINKLYLDRINIETDENLSQFFKNSFDLIVPKRPPYEIAEKANREVQSNFSFEAVYFVDSILFYAIEKDGHFSLFSYENTIIKRFDYDFEHSAPQNLMVITKGKRILIYDLQRFEFHLLGANLEEKIDAKFCQISHFTFSSNKVVYVVNESTIVSSPINLFLSQEKIIRYEHGKVTCLAVNFNSNVLVTSLQSGKVNISCLENGELIGLFNANEPILNLVISLSWNFVVCETRKNLFLLTMNAILIKKVKKKSDILLWKEFVTLTKSIDYVLCVDDKNKVFAFQFFYPEKSIDVYQLDSKALSMKLDNQSAVLATENGKITIIELSVFETYT